MAGVDVGSGGGGRRQTNSDINMIPFIDLLMVTIAFLLITAVWASHARLNANAEVPSQTGCGNDCPDATGRIMHVHVNDNEFHVVWKAGNTTVSDQRLARTPTLMGGEKGEGSTVRYPELAKVVEDEWKKMGEHHDKHDKHQDRAVIHTADALPFREVAAVLDAVSAPQRDIAGSDGASVKVPAFHATFSIKP